MRLVFALLICLGAGCEKDSRRQSPPVIEPAPNSSSLPAELKLAELCPEVEALWGANDVNHASIPCKLERKLPDYPTNHGIKAAALIAYDGNGEIGMSDQSLFLAVGDADKWRVTHAVASRGMRGVHGQYYGGDVTRFEFIDYFPGGDRELVVEHHEGVSTLGFEGESLGDQEWYFTTICSGLQCISIMTGEKRTSPTGGPTTSADPDEKDWEVKVEGLAEENIRITVIKEDSELGLPDHVGLFLGVHSFAELTTKSELVPRSVHQR